MTDTNSAPFFKAHIAGRDYLLDRLNLGELRVMDERFGLSQIEDFNPTNPRQIVGLLTLCMVREGIPMENAQQLVEAIDFMDLIKWMESDAKAVMAQVEKVAAEAAAAERPTTAAKSGGKSGGAAKPRKKPGQGS